jgi:hypothetical protein
MAMLISKFHRLIQSKLLWLAFLIVVVFTFVIWGTQVPQTSEDAQEAAAPGTMNGKPVPREVFRAAYMNTYLQVVMAYGRQITVTPQVDKELRAAAWQRLAALDEGKKLGLTVNDNEVAESIQLLDVFKHEGQFNKALYKGFVQEVLPNLGFTERHFEEYVREEITLQKMRLVLNQGVLVSPHDVQRTFHSISDRFKIEYVALKPDLVTNEISVTKDDARAYFAKEPAAFTLPEMVRVKFVRFATTPFIAKVKVAPEEVEQHYNDHLEDYVRTNDPASLAGTNDLASATDTNILASATDTNAAATNALALSKYLPFEEVKQDISNQLIQRGAMDLAEEEAMKFVESLTPDRNGNALKFEEAATAKGLLVEEPPAFARAETVKNIDAGLAFNRASFELTPGADTYFSNPVEGTDYVYVIALQEQIAERVPAFEEVADKVLPIARAQAIADALGDKAKKARDEATQAIKAGKPFADAFSAYGVAPLITGEFTASTGATTNEYSELLMRGVMTLNEGEVSELLPADDAILIAHVIERKPGDPTTLSSLKDQIVGSIRRQNTRLLFDAWQTYLLKQANFEDRSAPSDEPAPEDEAVDESADT